MIDPNTGASVNLEGNTGSAPTGPEMQTSTGQPVNGQDVNLEKNYKELEQKMGSMGQELGEYRNFFHNISPLLEKLDQNPELVQAIIDGKIDKQLTQAAYEGRISVSDANAVSQASSEVHSELGKKVVETLSPEKIEKLIEDRANKIRAELEEKAELKSFEDKTREFIESTSDFVKYSEAIDKWLDEHDVTDIKVAYFAVKGEMSEQEAKRAAEEAAKEGNRQIVANATGGGITAQAGPDGIPIIDKLVGGPVNPII